MTANEPPGTVSIETLKRVKEAEEAAEGQLAAARAEATATLARLRSEAAEAVQTARAEAEAARAAAVAEARAQAEAEAAALLAEGRKAAERIEMKASQAVAARREKVLAIVLGGVQPGREG